MEVIGAITGSIGAIAGIFGAIVGFIAYRRSNQLKKSDRCLSLQQVTNDAVFKGEQLLEILAKAFPSRMALFSLAGVPNSDILQTFEVQHQVDSNRAKELAQQITREAENTDYSAMSLHELEQGLVRIDKIRGEIDYLIDKYQKSIDEDEIGRARLDKARY